MVGMDYIIDPKGTGERVMLSSAYHRKLKFLFTKRNILVPRSVQKDINIILSIKSLLCLLKTGQITSVAYVEEI